MAKSTSTQTRSIESVLSEFSASAPPVLPGQSSEQYHAGLQALITELQAHTPMQAYLAQKMFDCMWWLRSYDLAQYSVIAETMINILKLDVEDEEDLSVVLCLRRLDWSNSLVQDAAHNRDHTVQSLQAIATTACRDRLLQLEQLSTIRTKTLNQLQAAYEALVNRSIFQERLELQNKLLVRDLSAIDVPTTGRAS